MTERSLLRIMKDTPITPKSPMVLEALCQEPRTEAKYIFPIIPQPTFHSGEQKEISKFI